MFLVEIESATLQVGAQCMTRQGAVNTVRKQLGVFLAEAAYLFSRLIELCQQLFLFDDNYSINNFPIVVCQQTERMYKSMIS